MMKVSSACSKHGGDENAFRTSVRKLAGKRPVGRPRHRWKDINGSTGN